MLILCLFNGLCLVGSGSVLPYLKEIIFFDKISDYLFKGKSLIQEYIWVYGFKALLLVGSHEILCSSFYNTVLSCTPFMYARGAAYEVQTFDILLNQRSSLYWIKLKNLLMQVNSNCWCANSKLPNWYICPIDFYARFKTFCFKDFC